MPAKVTLAGFVKFDNQFIFRSISLLFTVWVLILRFTGEKTTCDCNIEALKANCTLM
jgi:hypothetical protein